MMRSHTVLILLTLGFSFWSCKQNTADKAAAPARDSIIVEQTIPPIDSNAGKEVIIDSVSGVFKIESPSTVNWTASDPTSTHVGTVDISSGSIEIKSGKIVSGSFLVDMKTIHSTDLSSDNGKEKLERQLASPDFFDVDKYPDAKFIITKSVIIRGSDKTRHHIKGDLTIKDKTLPIECDAYIIVSNNGNLLTATTPSFEINRIDYGIKYRSGLIGTVKDKIISDKIGMVVNIRAKK